MNTKAFLAFSTAILFSLSCSRGSAEVRDMRYIQIAELEIDQAQLGAYKVAVQEQIDTAIRAEPGVLVLYSVSAQDNPAHVRVFEIYRDIDAYRAHLNSAHFKKYKAVTQKMVKSLMLLRVDPIALGAKPN
jgi:quinol monooxygenase YgiN